MSEPTRDVSASHIDELPQLWDGMAKMVRAGLGIEAFGVQILDLGPDYTTRAHDETASGQEELYVALRGAGAVMIEDDPDADLALDPDHLVRVGPGVARRLRSGPEGLRVMCIGGRPGAPYEAPAWTDTGSAP